MSGKGKDKAMNKEEGRNRKEWVKNAAIVFLTIMLVLTFFSNTIMNYSLPEVATQYVQSGTITAKVRGTGNVEAADPYNIVAKESRVISSVAVKQGDEVEKDQVIYYLEDAESEELTKAQAELEELKLTYMKGLFGNNVSSDIISKVASGRTDGFSALQTKVADMQNRMDAAQARVKECQEALERITLQSTINTNNAGVNTIEAENAVTRADVELSNAQNDESRAEQEFNQEISHRKAEITNEINELKRRIEDIQVLINGAGAVTERTGDSSVDIDVNNNSSGDNNSSSNTTTIDGISVPDKQTLIEEYKIARDKAFEERDKKLEEIYQAVNKPDNGYQGGKNINELKAWIIDNGKEKDYEQLLQDYSIADAQYSYAVQKLQEAEKNLSGYDGNLAALKNLNSQLAAKEAELNRVAAITYEAGDDVRSAQKKLSEAKQNLTDQTNANKQAEAAYQNQVANAEAALKNAQAVYDLLKEEQEEMNTDINAELDLAKVSKDIAQKEEEIAKLTEKSMEIGRAHV